MTPATLTTIGMLLLAACLIAIVTRKLGLPYIVGLVVAGLGLALLPSPPAVPLSRTLIFDVLLPPLIFEGAMQLEWARFRRELPLTLALALIGVAISAAAVTVGMRMLFGWSILGAALFGVLIAATDPVSVIAAFKELEAEPRLAMVVESESLLNDAVAAVGFTVLIGAAAGAMPSAGGAALAFVTTAGIGLAVGAIVCGVALLLAYSTADPLVEIAITAVAAYGSFLVAEELGGSGVLAAMVAGLIAGNVGWYRQSGSDRSPDLANAWAFFAFLANSFVFLLIGLNLGGQPILASDGLRLAALVLLVLVARALAVYPLGLLFRPTRLRLPTAYQHVLLWGGLRGALALALALSIPPSVPERAAILTASFAVVACSIIVQGLTMPPLLRALRVTRTTAADDDAG